MTRVYPTCCTSAFCGRLECTGCPDEPSLLEFRRWRARTGAICADPVWCPNVYTARHRKTDDRYCR